MEFLITAGAVASAGIASLSRASIGTCSGSALFKGGKTELVVQFPLFFIA